MKVYKTRRDLFCSLLKTNFSDFFEFEIPKGGMAVWVKLNQNYSWKSIEDMARKHQLEIGEWQRYDTAKIGHNAIRVGFATYNEAEIIELIKRLKLTFTSLSKIT